MSIATLYNKLTLRLHRRRHNANYQSINSTAQRERTPHTAPQGAGIIPLMLIAAAGDCTAPCCHSHAHTETAPDGKSRMVCTCGQTATEYDPYLHVTACAWLTACGVKQIGLYTQR
jgi:hypothetical protein